MLVFRCLVAVAFGTALLGGAAPAAGESIESLKTAAKKPPKAPEQALELGRALRRAGLFNDAVRVLRSSYARAGAGELAERLRLEAARTYIAADQQKLARRECGSFKGISRIKQQVCIGEAALLWRRASLALPAAERALELSARDYDALVVKGRALQLMGKASEAEAALREAIAVDPSAFEAPRYLGELLQLAGRKADATALLRKAEANAPQEPEVLVLLAGAVTPGNEALKLLERAIAIRPDYGAAHASMGRVLAQQKQPARAARALEKAILTNPKNADWRAALARVRLDQGDAASALAEARRALKLVANHGPAKLAEADALAASGDIDMAIEAYEAAYGYSRMEPAALVHAARSCLSHKRPTTAQAFAERATQSFPKWGPAWEVLGDVARASNDKPVARDAYKKALAGEGPVDRAAVQKKLSSLN